MLAELSYIYADVYGLNEGVHDVTTGDVNGDGFVDLAGVHAGRDEAFILFGDKELAFERRVAYPVGISPGAVQLVDLDGDTDLDLVTANSDTHDVSVLLNQRGGEFGAPVSHHVGFMTARGLVADDFSGDGHADLAVSSFGDVLGVLISDGNGGFGNVVTYDVPDAERLFAGDVNGDGWLDLVSWGIGYLYLFLNDGNGTFHEPEVHPRDDHPVSAAALGDLNGDGNADLVAGHNSGDSVTVFLSNDEGTSIQNGDYDTGHQVWKFLLPQDLNNDGHLDLVVDNKFGTITTLVGNGDGTFRDPASFSVPSGGRLASADFDGDGLWDIATGGADGIHVLLNVTKNTPVSVHQAGDANRDFVFDQLDIVEVLQSAKYLTGEPADWNEGDWDENGVFNQLDIVFALATGNYLQGPYAAHGRVVNG